MALLRSGTNYFAFDSSTSTSSLTSSTATALNISDTETPDIVPHWLAYAGTKFPSQDFEVVIEAANSLPPIKDLPPNH